MTKVLPPSGDGGPPVEIEDGSYPATCFKVADSEWPAGDFGYGPKEARPATIISMMIDDVLDGEGQNVIVDCKVTLSAHEKSTLSKYASILLGRDVRGKPFDTEELVAGRAIVEVSHTENGYPRIVNMAALPKGMR